MYNIKSHFKNAKELVNSSDSAEKSSAEALDFLASNATNLNKQQTNQFLDAVEQKFQSFGAISRYEMFLNSVSPLSYNLTELVAERKREIAYAKEASPTLVQNATILKHTVELEPC